MGRLFCRVVSNKTNKLAKLFIGSLVCLLFVMGPQIAQAQSAVTDSQGRQITINSDGKVYENGIIPIGFTDKVIDIEFTNGKLYQENINNDWWYWDGYTWIAATAPSVTQSTPQSTTQTVNALVTTNTPIATKSHQVGFAANAFQSLSSTDQAKWLADFQKLGITWLRMDANWSNIGNFSKLDTAVKAAESAHINVLLIIDGNNNGGVWSAPNPSSFANYSKTLVAHYAPMGVHSYEVWNEPNNTAFWSTGPNADQYTQVLKAAYPAIKSADSTSTVLAGSVCPCAINPLMFIQQMYSAGAKGYFDALSVHPYTYPAPIATGVRWQELNNNSPSIRSVMANNGDSAKQVWITEFGAPTSTYSNAVSETEQASQLSSAIKDCGAQSWCGPLFLYTYQTSEQTSNNNEDWFGIVHNNGQPKPAYDAIKSAISNIQ